MSTEFRYMSVDLCICVVASEWERVYARACAYVRVIASIVLV